MESFAEHIRTLSIQFVPFIMAVIFHEFGHALMAHFWGDDTAKESGRLTLNPIPHIDILGTLIFPMVNMLSGMNLLFGWAKPVPINPRRFKKMRAGLFWVAAAGPLTNFILAFLSACAFCMIRLWVPRSFYLFEPLLGMSYISVSLNFALGIFNLIPLPPLDGGRIVASVLPYEAEQKYNQIAQYSFFILLALMFTGALNVLSYPIRIGTNLTLFIAGWIFKLPEMGF